MKSLGFTIAGSLLACLIAPAQVSESMVRWPYFQEVQIAPGAGLADFLLDAEALDGSRDDGADFRLYNAAGAEVPYALRVLRDVNRSDAFEATEFNRASAGLTSEMTFDLGTAPEEHNEVEIDTAGANFRRRADVLGSPDGSSWFALRQGALLFRFSSSGRSVDEQRVDYPPSRYRYLRVQVAADPLGETRAPTIESVVIRRRVQARGEEVEYQAGYPVREPTRDDSRPASAFRIDLLGRIPLHALRLSVADGTFSRPYRLERIDDDATQPVVVSSGNLSRNDEQGDITLRFEEIYARELRLVVTDDRNAALALYSAMALGAARQIVFDRATAGAGPLRLYYGNAAAAEPRYDFGATLPFVLPQQPQRFSLGSRQNNPDYRPPELPFTERVPWAVYLVLAVAVSALFWILRDIVLKVEGAEPQAEAAE